MWEFTQDPKVSTQVHWDPREDTFSMTGLPRVRGGSEVPGNLKLREQQEARGWKDSQRMILTKILTTHCP